MEFVHRSSPEAACPVKRDYRSFVWRAPDAELAKACGE
jgi:hypothetical protein